MTTTTPELFTEHRFRKAFVEVQPRLAAIPAESLLTINLDIQSAVVMVLGSAPVSRALWREVDDDAVVKITGASDQPLQLIRRYRNESQPAAARYLSET